MFTENSISISPSKKEEVESLVPLIYSSGPDAFNYIFQTKKHAAQDFLKFVFLKSSGEFSYLNHTTAYLNNEIVGVGAIFEGKQMLGFTLSIIVSIIQFYKFSAISVLIKGLQVECLIVPPKKNEATIGHLGITKNLQGKGIGKQLITHIFNTKTYQKVVLDVTDVNPAIHLYKKLGFIITKTNISKLKNEFVEVPNHYRMEK